MDIITGYRTKLNDIGDIELLLNEMQKRVEKIATKEFHKQLSNEIENVVDLIALNIKPQPELPILQIAKAMLIEKINFASQQNCPTKYNYNVSVHVLTLDGYVYFKYETENDLFRRVGLIKGIESYSYKENSKTDSEQKWIELMKKYSIGTHPLGVKLITEKIFDVNEKMLIFKKPSQRAARIARHRLTDRYLAMFSCQKEILPYQLMELMDEALDALASVSSSDRKIEEDIQKLVPILPNITVEMIKETPKVP